MQNRCMLRLIACLVGAATLTGCAAAAASPDPEQDKSAIEAALRQWPTDFNDENLDGVCGLFAGDAVLAYPGGEDHGSGEFCARMQTLFNDPEKEQFERNRDFLRARSKAIPAEIERETAAIRSRFADPQPRMVAVICAGA